VGSLNEILTSTPTGIQIVDQGGTENGLTFDMSLFTTDHTVQWPDAAGIVTLGGNTFSGTGNIVRATSPTLVTPNLGTPSAATLTNATGLPISTGVSGLASGIATFLATSTSANLATAVTDETGSGVLVFGTSPTLVTPTLGAATVTTLNKVTITAPATGSTLTIADGKTLTASNNATVSGTNTGDQTITLTGDVTGSGTGSFSTSVNLLHPNTTLITSSNSPYSVAATDFFIGADATSGVITINLPAATGTHRLVAIKKIDAVNNVTITPNGTDTIDGVNASMVASAQNANHVLMDAASGVWYTYHRVAVGGCCSGSTNNITVNVLNTTATTAGTSRSDTATAPTASASTQAGVNYSITASNATAGTTNAGAQAGGIVNITAGNAARLTSGNANGGGLNLSVGNGIGTGTIGFISLYNSGYVSGSIGLPTQPLLQFGCAGTNCTTGGGDGFFYTSNADVALSTGGTAASTIVFARNGSSLGNVGVGSVALPNTGSIGWGSAALVSGAVEQTVVDTWLIRSAPSVVKFSANGSAQYPPKALTLSNGANNDLAIAGAGFVRVTGPTGAFSISGFAAGQDGEVLRVYNATSQAMTITNKATSTAANQINTLTGADVVLRTGQSFATFIYDGTSSFWILTAAN
jgi:hypothetical protein